MYDTLRKLLLWQQRMLNQYCIKYCKVRQKNLNQNHVTACACTINITCHSTVDGVSEISVQVRAQAVAMATKHPDISLVCGRNPYLNAHSSWFRSLWRLVHAQSTSHLIPQSMVYRKTAFKYVHKPLLWQQNTLNYKFVCKGNPCADAHSSWFRSQWQLVHAQSMSHVIAQSMEYRKTVFKYVHKPLLWQQNTLNYSWFVKEISIWMHTPPDFDPSDGLCTHNQCHMS